MCGEAETVSQELSVARATLDKLLEKRNQAPESGSDVSLDIALRTEDQQRYIQQLETKLTRMQQPIISLSIQHDVLVEDEWSSIQSTARNEGYGPAHDLVIQVAGEHFESKKTNIERIATLQVSSEYTVQLDVRPLEHGDNVLLQLRMEYKDHAGGTCVRERVISLPVEKARRLPPATRHVLSFNRLSPADFERLCLWLVECEGYVHAEHLGLAGSEQGRDVVAYKTTPRGEELWYFQCKRYRSISAGILNNEVDKYLHLSQEKPHLRPTGVVFVVSCAVSAKVREEVGEYCEQHDLTHEFWALTELDMRVKRHPDLLREFFNLDL